MYVFVFVSTVVQTQNHILIFATFFPFYLVKVYSSTISVNITLYLMQGGAEQLCLPLLYVTKPEQIIGKHK